MRLANDNAERVRGGKKFFGCQNSDALRNSAPCNFWYIVPALNRDLMNEVLDFALDWHSNAFSHTYSQNVCVKYLSVDAFVPASFCSYSPAFISLCLVLVYHQYRVNWINSQRWSLNILVEGLAWLLPFCSDSLPQQFLSHVMGKATILNCLEFILQTNWN